jgi:hypothetical protein
MHDRHIRQIGDQKEFNEIETGSNKLKSYVYSGKFSLESGILCAAKAACLVAAGIIQVPDIRVSMDGVDFTTDGRLVFTTDGRLVFTTDGRLVFTTDGRLVFTTDGRLVFTTDGRLVFTKMWENLSHTKKMGEDKTTWIIYT